MATNATDELYSLAVAKRAEAASEKNVDHDSVEYDEDKVFHLFKDAADLFCNSGCLEEAVKCLDEALSLIRYPALVLQRASLLLALGEDKKALDAYTSIIPENPYFPESSESSTARKARARLRLASGKCLGAIEDCNMALKFSTGDIEALRLRGQAYLLQGDTKKAKNDFSSVIEHNPGDVVALTARAGIFRQDNRLGGAIKDYDEALKADPNHVPALLGRGIALCIRKVEGGSIADFRRAVELQADALARLSDDDKKELGVAMTIAEASKAYKTEVEGFLVAPLVVTDPNPAAQKRRRVDAPDDGGAGAGAGAGAPDVIDVGATDGGAGAGAGAPPVIDIDKTDEPRAQTRADLGAPLSPRYAVEYVDVDVDVDVADGAGARAKDGAGDVAANPSTIFSPGAPNSSSTPFVPSAAGGAFSPGLGRGRR